jgi:hypothetical protein
MARAMCCWGGMGMHEGCSAASGGLCGHLVNNRSSWSTVVVLLYQTSSFHRVLS